MNAHSVRAVLMLALCMSAVTAERTIGFHAIVAFVASVAVATLLSKAINRLARSSASHPLLQDASLSFFGVFFGSFAASIGEPLFGAMLASSCSAIALVRAAAWLAGFEAGGE